MRLRPLILCMLLGMMVGCRAPSQPPVAAYFGPTLPLDELINQVNANDSKIPTLRGAGNFEAWIAPDRQTKPRYLNGQITMLFSQQQSMRLVGKKDIAGTLFDLGSNDERYWVIVRPETDTMWTGRWDQIAKADPEQLPIRPDLVLETLGVQPLATELKHSPVPVLRFNNDADVYMVVWSVPLQTRWAAQKEVWYDRKTLRPTNVLLFDENGRIVVRAYLRQPKKVQLDGKQESEWPLVATQYDLLFPATGSKMLINLEDVALKRNGAPNPRSFTFPGDDAGVSHVIDIDEPSAR